MSRMVNQTSTMPLRRSSAIVRIISFLVATLCWTLAAQSQTLTTLYSFAGRPTDGADPYAMVRNADGSVFGTTYFGGPSNFGTVFQLTGAGEEVLHSFTGPDGENPCSALTIAADGHMYGTTESGGLGLYGTVFALRGTQFKTIHEFSGGPGGANPVTGVIASTDGSLYGTTAQGGTGDCAGGCGVVYKIDKSGREIVMHSFSGPDGAYPSGRLITDAHGNLFGTTLGGGGSTNLCPPYGCGTVFKLDAAGKFTLLHSFTGGPSDGWFITSGAVRDPEGNLYGTTGGGGTYNFGTIYEITNAGEEKVLYSFEGAPDGANPQQIVRTPSGALLGVTYQGGIIGCAESVSGCGSIFEFDASKETVLYRFMGTVDGAYPTGPVFIDSLGNLYGTTVEGIQNGCSAFSLGCGTVWKLEIGNTD